MIKIPPLALLFLAQFLLICLGLAVFLFLRNRKLRLKEIILQGEACRLRSEMGQYARTTEYLSGLKEKFDDVQEKFAQVNNLNTKLKDAVKTMSPEEGGAKEYEQLIAEIEKNNRELDRCLGTLQKDNDNLNEQTKSFKNEVDKLTHKLQHSVSVDEFNNLKAENEGLELKIKSLKKDVETKNQENETLQKNYLWLEKEYNALYNNINEEKAS